LIFDFHWFVFFSGIFHFVKDNYFRTSSSSSEDEYDSDDSAHKGENATTLAANTANKTQPVGVPLATTTNVAAAAVVPMNIGSAQSTGSDGNK
jgi:hypothetical protein